MGECESLYLAINSAGLVPHPAYSLLLSPASVTVSGTHLELNISWRMNRWMLRMFWMDPEVIILGEESQRRTNVLWYCLYMESKKMIQTNLFYKTKAVSKTFKKNILTASKGERLEGRDKLRVWDEQIHTTIYKIDKQLYIYIYS